jgi:hypothetical protein
MKYHLLLRECVHDYAIAAILRQRWAYKSAKSEKLVQIMRGESAHSTILVTRK